MNPIEYFNNNNRIKYWSKNKEEYQRWFRRQLKHLLLDIEDGATEKELAAFMWRLGLGNYAIGKQGGIPSGVRTKASIGLPSSKLTNDHVFGTVEMGKYVHQEFEKHNFDIDYMVDTWLYENLWLWITIKVARTEHHVDNINRNQHTLDEKKEFKHYVNVSEFIY